jgi:glycine/D-amino acid oxidase-like deaminating enzyme
MDIEECKAGIRVVNSKHYLPIVGKLSEGLWVMTAMGSRGLLYHAYAAEELSKAILFSRTAESNNIFPYFDL